MREYHPYGVYIPKRPKAMIIGSFPIGKFTDPKRKIEIKKNEHDFFFGGETNLLWKLLGDVFKNPVQSKKEIIKMLEGQGLGIGDVIISCRRRNGGAADSDLYDIQWNNELLLIIKKFKIRKLYFTSRKVEVWFEKLFPQSGDLEKISLISPSAQIYRSLPKNIDFQKWLIKNPLSSKYEFILRDFREKLIS